MPNQVVQTNTYDHATGRSPNESIDKETGGTHVDDITTLLQHGRATHRQHRHPGRHQHRPAVLHLRPTRRTDPSLDRHGRHHHNRVHPRSQGIGHCTTTTPSAATIGGPAPYWQTYH